MYQCFIHVSCRADSVVWSILPTLYPFTNGWAFELFHFLPVTNNAAMNLHVQTFMWIFVCWFVFSFLLDTSLGVEFLSHSVILCKPFAEMQNCLAKKRQHFTPSPAMFSNICFYLFMIVNLPPLKVVSPGFDLHFTNS